MHKQRINSRGTPQQRHPKDTVYCSLFMVILLIVSVPSVTAAGFIGSTDTSGAVDGSSPSIGGGTITESQDPASMDKQPLQMPVAVILLSGSTGAVHQQIRYDGSHSYIKSNPIADCISSVNDDGSLEPLALFTSNEYNDEEDTAPDTTSPLAQQNLPLCLYSWDFGDETQALGATVEHVYEDTGIYQITLQVTDDKNNTNTTNTTITILPEQVTGLSIQNPGTGGTLLLRWNALSENQVVYYQIYRDDRVDPFTTIRTSYQDTGLVNGRTYHYAIAAVDYTGSYLFIGHQSEKKTATPTLNNIPPITHTCGPYFTWINQPVCFDGSTSKDIDGTITQYQWDFGDGTTATGKTVQHSYTKPGTFAVSLTTMDNAGATNTDTTIVTVRTTTQMVVASITRPNNSIVNTPLSFKATLSDSSLEKNLKYLWDFGDGNTNTASSPTHTYLIAGTYIVSLTITNEAGLSSTNTTNMTILPVQTPPEPPVVTFTPNKASMQEYHFCIFSSDLENQQVRYRIDWGDDTTTQTPWFPSGTQVHATHTWNAPGAYQIIVTVEDETNTFSQITQNTLIVPSMLPMDLQQTQQDTHTSLGSPLSQSLSESSIMFLVALIILSEGIILGFFMWKIKKQR